MSTVDVLVVIVAVAAAVVILLLYLFGNHPWSGNTTSGESDDEPLIDRPAGPAAETMDPDELGGDHRLP